MSEFVIIHLEEWSSYELPKLWTAPETGDEICYYKYNFCYVLQKKDSFRICLNNLTRPCHSQPIYQRIFLKSFFSQHRAPPEISGRTDQHFSWFYTIADIL